MYSAVLQITRSTVLMNCCPGFGLKIKRKRKPLHEYRGVEDNPEDVEPVVSRTLQVPLNIRLDRLHLTIQEAMGWYNCHLYSFMAAGASWGVSDPDWGGEDLPANKSTLWDVIEDTGVRTLEYVYDFGDNWEHRIKIGKITDPCLL